MCLTGNIHQSEISVQLGDFGESKTIRTSNLLYLKELEQKINDVDTLQIFTTGLNGRSVTLQVHAGNAESFFKKGVGFDGSSVPGYGTVDNSDKRLIPLPDTFREVPFAQENFGFLIGKTNEA